MSSAIPLDYSMAAAMLPPEPYSQLEIFESALSNGFRIGTQTAE